MECNSNVELLNYVYQNSAMGLQTLKLMEDITEDINFKDTLTNQYNEYLLIHQEAKGHLHEHNLNEKGLSKMTKMRTNFMIKMQTMFDDSTSNLAELLIVGSTMGVIDAIKKSKEFHDADQHIVDLMDRLKVTEENNIESLKNYV